MPKKKYRCLYDIIYDILKAINELYNPNTTLICQKANLPYDRCMVLIKILEEHGLLYTVNEHNRKRIYLTENGYIYIGLYDEIQKIIQLRLITTITSERT